MRLCMFHPADHPMERGWVGRIDGEHVIHLAAQTLQSFFTGGGSAREHAVYALADVRLLAPILHPPAVRVFEHETSFEFGNPGAIVGPRAEIAAHARPLAVLPRAAAVIGAEASIGGFSICADWRALEAPRPKDRDFALGLGPVVVTPDELGPDRLGVVVRVDGDEMLRSVPEAFDWGRAREFAADGTALYPGDILLGPAVGCVDGLGPSSVIELAVEGIGVLYQSVAPTAPRR
jgi:2-keto-4-pentenoate hydratase/2-oxohepta-3-ene-1,7-dioic acid hydratase in catechol pathway